MASLLSGTVNLGPDDFCQKLNILAMRTGATNALIFLQIFVRFCQVCSLKLGTLAWRLEWSTTI